MPQCSCCCSAAGHETNSKSTKKWTSEREDLSKLTLAVVEAEHSVARYSPMFHSQPDCWFAVRTLSIHYDFRSPWWKKGLRISRVTTPSLVKVRCSSHCCVSCPFPFSFFFLFFVSFWHFLSSAGMIVNLFNAVPFNKSTTILYSYRP